MTCQLQSHLAKKHIHTDTSNHTTRCQTIHTHGHATLKITIGNTCACPNILCHRKIDTPISNGTHKMTKQVTNNLSAKPPSTRKLDRKNLGQEIQTHLNNTCNYYRTTGKHSQTSNGCLATCGMPSWESDPVTHQRACGRGAYGLKLWYDIVDALPFWAAMYASELKRVRTQPTSSRVVAVLTSFHQQTLAGRPSR